MSRAPLLYVGILFTVIASSLGLITLPEKQLVGLEPVVDDNGVARPVEPGGAVAEGRELYRALGCLYCHSQQVRPQGFGADLERGWGERRTVARDHIFDRPPLLGTMRTGPDLANIGARQPSESWHYLHLYEPTLTSPGSTMPPFRFLFQEREQVLGRPADALELPARGEGAARIIVPRPEAKALVAYLKSLDHGYAVPEVP